MPSGSRQSRAARCAWREHGQRCVRSASGPDGLCKAHRIAAEEVSRAHATPRPFGAGFGAVLDDLFSGRGITEASAAAALDDLGWMMGGNLGAEAGMFPDDQREAPPQNPGFRPPPGQRLPPNWRPRQPPPPPPDPLLEERRLARQVLGFPDGMPLTPEMVSQRRKELARKHHPDRGGSLEKMQAVNSAADLLLEAMG